jgi:hypothetical protein
MRSARVGRIPGLAGVLTAACLVVVGASTGRPADQEGPKPSKPGAAKPAYLDTMVRDAWKKAGVKPSPVASDAEFMRRLYLDLLGRIPSAKEAADFLSSKQKGKRAKLVEYLLADPDYPKNFGNIFTNVLVGRKPQGRRVDSGELSGWLRRQFAANRPWNEMAYELITAKGSNKENGAVNYPLAHLQDGAVNLTSFTTRIFLGQQIQCTQCHDHPMNETWKQADFWGINAFFKGVRSREVTKSTRTGAEEYDHTEVYDEPSDAYSTYENRKAIVNIAFPKYLDGRKISQGTDVDRREALGRYITEPQNEQLPKAFVNRMWGHFMGRGFVQPVDDFGGLAPPTLPEVLDKLAADFKADGYNVQDLIRWITNSEAYQLTSETTKSNEKDETLFSHMQLKPLTPEQIFDALLIATAAHKAGGDRDADRRRREWLNQFIFVFGNDEADESANFQGTIPQALLMMNGPLMEQAVGCKPGSYLAKVRDEALKTRNPELFMTNRLYLSALGRYPTSHELRVTREFLVSTPDSLEILEDVFWSLLNSNEFVLNH